MWGDSIPSSDEYIDAAFGHGGYLAQRWGASYQPREPQLALARAVDRALAGRTHLLSEAPTGTGKSLAYSVPATYHAAVNGKRVVIVTANIALQEQLVKKDLPLLADVLPWGFSFGLMKGRNNYLCRLQYERVHLATRQPAMFGDEDMQLSREERERSELMRWAESELAQLGYGDASTLDWKPPDRLWREFSVGPDDCRGRKCRFAADCGALRAQRDARASQVVVTNYHLFFVHLLIHMEKGRDVLLPPFDAVVFDEAHKAADIARDFFGWKITDGSVKRVSRYVRDTDGDLAEKLQRASGWFFGQMHALKRDRNRYRARIVADRLDRDDREAAATLLERLSAAQEIVARNAGSDDRETAAAADVAMKGVGRLIGAVGSVLTGGGENDVLFVEEDEFKKSASVSCRLVRPAQVLRGALFDKTVVHVKEDGEEDGAPVDPFADQPEPEREALPISVVCTSATLATDSRFDFVRDELGAPRGCEELVVDSPFDYPEQALLIIPEVCDPNDDGFTREVAALFLRTIVLARGRTLGLFTSRKRMKDVYDSVAGQTPFRILKQDDGQRTWLIDEFKRDTHSVLMGVASFWAGVDVQGESLSCVFIDKLPFPTPDDPVLDRLAENDKRAWAGYAIPRAIIELKQGFGRLIRSATDRGVVVCCDNRLVTKGYGKQFLRAMPRGMQKVKNLESIREWIDGADAEPAPPQAAEEVDPFS